MDYEELRKIVALRLIYIGVVLILATAVSILIFS
jgi:hypothetical protein